MKRNKLALFLTLVVFLAFLPVFALADTQYLSIDKSVKAPGMDKTFAEGYTPVSSNDKVRIIIPLKETAANEVSGAKISVAPNFSGVTSPPFVFSNLQKDFDFNASTRKSVIDFELPLSNKRVNGQYQISFDVSFNTVSDGEQTQAFSVYFNITDGIDPDATPAPTKKPTAEGKGLVLDTKNVYNGMDKSYSGGYAPKVKDGKVYVVIPLLEKAKVTGSKISVAPDYSSAGTNFSASNAKKEYRLKDNTTSGGKTVSSYLIDFPLSLSKKRTNGQYPVTFNVSYETDAGEQSQSFSVYVNITDGKDAGSSASGGSTGAEKPKPQPKLIVENYFVSPDPAMAGETCTLTVVLKNTNETQKVQNIRLALSSESTDILPSEEDGTQYIASLDKKESKDLTFNIKVRKDAKPQPTKLTLNIDYDDSKATAITTSATMMVEVKQEVKLEIDEPKLQTPLNAGDTIPFSLGIFNMGKGTLYNVLCKMDVPGLLPEGNVFLGNMEAGTSKTAEFSVFVGTKDMESSVPEAGSVEAAAAEDTSVQDEAAKDAVEAKTEDAAEQIQDDYEKYGPTSGKVIVTFEDEFGQAYTEEVDISTEINRPFIPEPEEPALAEQEQPKASQWWISVLIAGIIVLALIAFFIIRNRILAKKRDEADAVN